MKNKQYYIIGDPVPKARPRHNTKTGITYTPKKTQIAESYVKDSYISQGGKIIDGPVEVKIEFYLRKPKKPTAAEPLKRPDIDNLTKTILDGLNGVAYEDDKQIIKVITEKHWADDEPMTVFSVYEYKNNI